MCVIPLIKLFKFFRSMISEQTQSLDHASCVSTYALMHSIPTALYLIHLAFEMNFEL